eukprot:56300-Eustigmatos_ZCMA.PRE.1
MDVMDRPWSLREPSLEAWKACSRNPTPTGIISVNCRVSSLQACVAKGNPAAYPFTSNFSAEGLLDAIVSTKLAHDEILHL